jgi:opacity protein-like surface antigen
MNKSVILGAVAALLLSTAIPAANARVYERVGCGACHTGYIGSDYYYGGGWPANYYRHNWGDGWRWGASGIGLGLGLGPTASSEFYANPYFPQPSNIYEQPYYPYFGTSYDAWY